MKKLISIILILVVALVCFGGCIGAPIETIIPTPEATPTPDVPDTTPEPLKILEFSMIQDYSAGTMNFTKTPVVEFFLENWGLKCTAIHGIPYDISSDGEERIGWIFMRENAPDVMFTALLGQNGKYFNVLVEDDKVVDFLPYIKEGKLDTYMNNIWGGESNAWKHAKAALMNHKTNELYVLPERNYEIAYYTWLYNSYYFNNRYNTDVPSSDLNTIINIMKNFVAENPGCSAMLYDWGTAISDKWGYWGYFEREPIFNAHGVQHATSWRIINGKPVYSIMQDVYLDAIKTYKGLMDEGVMFAADQQYAPAGKSIYANKADAIKNNGALFAWNNVKELISMNDTAKSANKNYEWSILPEDPSPEGIEPVAYSTESFKNSGGVIISQTASDELKERLIELINWSASPEGERAFFYGIEGVSYEMVNGKVKFLKHYSEELTPDISNGGGNVTETVGYYRVGIPFASNKPHIPLYTDYVKASDIYQAMFNAKVEKMITNYSAVWGREEAVLQSVGKTAKEIADMESNIKKICESWRNAYYNDEATEADFAQMKADAIAAGYETVLAYRKALYEDAIK